MLILHYLLQLILIVFAENNRIIEKSTRIADASQAIFLFAWLKQYRYLLLCEQTDRTADTL